MPFLLDFNFDLQLPLVAQTAQLQKNQANVNYMDKAVKSVITFS
jgi:hypothetical protein